MNYLLIRPRPFDLLGALLLALLLSALAPVPASAAPTRNAASAPALFAIDDMTSTSWRSKVLSGLNTREGVVRVCVVTMAFALFILMKKLT